MGIRWRWAILTGGFGLYLIGMGFLGGAVSERVRFDHGRLTALPRYDEMVGKWTAHLMTPGKPVAGVEEATRQLHEALAKQDVRAAERAWLEAYAAARRSGGWQGLVETGDLALRIGDAAGNPKAAQPRARLAYRQAVVRARATGAVDGVLRAAEAFDRLGDREVAEQIRRLAEKMAAPRPEVRLVGQLAPLDGLRWRAR